jgi:hypothetical protein
LNYSFGDEYAVLSKNWPVVGQELGEIAVHKEGGIGQNLVGLKRLKNTIRLRGLAHAATPT